MKVIFLIIILACASIVIAEPDLHTCEEHGHIEKHFNSTGHEFLVCVCDKYYITLDDSEVFCNYNLKNRVTAFVLSFFLGEFGADWFYLSDGNTAYIIVGFIQVQVQNIVQYTSRADSIIMRNAVESFIRLGHMPYTAHLLIVKVS